MLWKFFSWLTKSKPRSTSRRIKRAYLFDDIAADFFRMPRDEQLEVLWFLSVGRRDARVILDFARPFDPVPQLIASREQAPLNCELWLYEIGCLIQEGRSYAVVAVFQHIFRDLDEARYYAGVAAECIEHD